MGTVHRPIATSWGCELYQRFVRRKPDGIWRCAAHIGPKWEVAVALGAGIDCARVSSLVVSRRQELALTPGLHPAVAQQMAETIVATVRLALAHNFTASAACLMGMLSHPTITTEECQALAAHPNMSPPGLRRLSHNHNTGVRLAVAHNPHASARTLHRLARDGHVDVAQAAKQNLWGRA